MNIEIKILSGDAVILAPDTFPEPSGAFSIEPGQAFEIVSPTGVAWRAMVCNEAEAGAAELWAEVRDDQDEPWDLHTLKPHGGWRTGWSVVLEGDPGDRGRVYVPSQVTAAVAGGVALPAPAKS